MYGKHHSEKVKKYISKLNSGKNNGFYGKKHSKEHIKKLTVNNKGAKATSIPICQFSLNGELIKIWPSLKGAARSLSENDLEFNSVARKIRIRSSKNKWDSFLDSFWRLKSDVDVGGFVFYEKPHIKRSSIKQVKNGEIVREWNSIKHIEDELGLNYHSLWKSINNFTEFAGFFWKRN